MAADKKKVNVTGMASYERIFGAIPKMLFLNNLFSDQKAFSTFHFQVKADQNIFRPSPTLEKNIIYPSANLKIFNSISVEVSQEEFFHLLKISKPVWFYQTQMKSYFCDLIFRRSGTVLLTNQQFLIHTYIFKSFVKAAWLKLLLQYFSRFRYH